MSDRFAKFWSQFEAVKEAMPDRAPLVYPPTAEPGNGISPEFVYEDGHGLFGPTVTDSPQARNDLRIGTPDTDQSDKPVQRRPVHGDMLEFLDKVARRGNDATAHHLVSICPVNLCPADEPATAQQPYWPPYDPDGGGSGVKIQVLDTGLFDGYKNISVVAAAGGERRNTFVTVPASPFSQIQGADADAVSGGTEQLIRLYAGHGTFIAGLIHQICPDARICSIKMMGTDGIVEEAALLNGLGYLHQRQSDALQQGDADKLIDIVSLSLGYYHESDLDGLAYDRELRDAVEALGQLGVLVVAAAGNNATTRPLLPAAFTPFSNGTLGSSNSPVPLVSVGALNPDGSVALFSNAGSWVACHSPGAALVSTLPIADVGERSGIDLGTADPTEREVASWRATIDPDSYTGFGTWSGTSFAAPVTAAAAAQALLDQGQVEPPNATTVERARQALTSLGFDLTPG
jgi:subtilisin family serine protease